MDSCALAPVPSATVEQVLGARGALAVDLRSPAEFAEDHLPGAANVPLFDDEQRALVGTLYRRDSADQAFAAARELARRRIRALVAEIGALAGWAPPAADLESRLLACTSAGIGALERELEPESCAADAVLRERPIVCYCWRGGLRSRSVVAFLREFGCERALVLSGGYRAWRRHVNAELARLLLPRAYVLRGLTGTGKTLVLRALERLRPGWTLDLEELAGHRSSILGAVGLRPVSQKAFESALFARCRRGFPGFLVVEGESRKVGDSVLPPIVWRALGAGLAIEITASAERRAQVLIEDYLAHPASRRDLAEKLPFLEQRLGARWHGKLVELLASARERELVQILLEHYYDPLYRHSEGGRSYAHALDAREPERAAAEIAAWIEART